MASGSITVKLRPLRLAFLVDPQDTGALVRAIQTCTSMWGGGYNPIIPYFRRLPKGWAQLGDNEATGHSIIAGYLEAFDPDRVILTGELEKTDWKFGHYNVLKLSEIIRTKGPASWPKIGIPLRDIFRDFATRELGFVRHDPVSFCFPTIDRSNELFFGSVFGALPAGICEEFDEALAGTRGLKLLNCGPDEYLDRLGSETLNLRRLGLRSINSVRLSQGQSSCIFLLDGRQPTDIIDFWNLRAAGWEVIPVEKRSAAASGILGRVNEFIGDRYFPLRGNPAYYHHATVMPARSITRSELQQFVSTLTLPQLERGHRNPALVVAPLYPRIWNEWAREKDNIEPGRLEVDEAHYEFQGSEGKAGFRTLFPHFAEEYGDCVDARCANEIEMRVWGGQTPLAGVIPQGGSRLVRSVCNSGHSEWRCGRFGPVFLPQYRRWQQGVQMVAAEPVFVAWMEEQGWNVELSDKGFIALQMFKQLGGLHGLQLLAHEGMLEFMGRLATRRRMGDQQFFGELTRISQNPRNTFASVQYLVERLISSSAVQLGIEVKCPHCRQRSWFSVKDADYMLRCTQCMSEHTLPSHSPKEIKWSYRAIGAFASVANQKGRAQKGGGPSPLPDQSYGSITVLLALRFFSEVLDGLCTPIMSFTATKQSQKFEADLGLFFRSSKFGESGSDLVFFECKSCNRFEKDDVDRMRVIGDAFPGACLVFATLNPTLTQREKRLLSPIVHRGRRYWKNERPYNPVVVLTRNELLAEWRLESTWEDLGGVHATKVAQLRHGDHRLLQIANATQEIYLEMKPWSSWLAEKWKRRQSRKDSRGGVRDNPADDSSNTPAVTAAAPTGAMVLMRQVPFGSRLS